MAEFLDIYDENGKPTGQVCEKTEAHAKRRHYSLYSDSLNYHPWEVAGNIKIPTPIIHGDADEVCPYDLSVRLHDLVKSSELITLPNMRLQYKERI
ncbi:MAG: lysophospholipase [Rickettsiales bacterium]|nr:lysophospholipase [Rickettsiales bacterium]